MKFTPHDYQKRAAKWLLSKGRGALFLDPGLGKTSVVYMAFQALRRRGFAKRMLVVAPLRVCHHVWPAEVEKWDAFGDLRVEVLHGKDKDKVLQRDADVYVINPDGLRWLEPHVGKWRFRPEVLVIDESTQFKSSRSQRFRIIKKFHHLFAYRWALTGTPIANGYLDLWAQLFLIDQGETLGRYFSKFRDEFFLSTGFGGYTFVLKRGAEEQIIKKTDALAYRLKLEDFVEMPDIVYEELRFDLPPKARKVYDTLESEFITELEQGEVLASNAGVKTQKLRQLANGAVYDDDGVVHEVHSAKLDTLRELMLELNGHPMVLAYEFKHDLDRMREALRTNIPALGEGSTRQDTNLIARWNKGLLPYLAIHPASGAHGLNLQEAGHGLIWFANIWSLEKYDQLIRRLYRQGRSKPVFVYSLVANETVDTDVIAVQKMKKRRQSAFLDSLKKRKGLK